MIQHVFPELGLYHTDPAQRLVTACAGLDYLSVDDLLIYMSDAYKRVNYVPSPRKSCIGLRM